MHAKVVSRLLPVLISTLPILSIWPFGPSLAPLPPLGYTSYSQTAVCQPNEEIRFPKTQDDVVAIVKEAISRKTTVKAFGHRHSISDIICTDGIPVDMQGIQGIVYHEENNTATVGAGVYLYDFTTFLRKRGRALKTTPAYGNITIGGAVGTGAHGSSIKFNASISEQVVALTIVDGQGQLRKIDKDEDLVAFRVHLGLLGIIVDVTLNTEPLYKVRAYNYVVSDKILTNGTVIDIARDTDQVSLYWFPSFRKVVISNWTIVDVKTRGKAKTNDHVPPTTKLFNSYATPAIEVLQHLNLMTGLNLFQGYSMQALLRTIPDFSPIYTENGLTVKNPAVGFYDLMFAPICKESGGYIQCPWAHGPNNNITLLDNEISLPLEQVPNFVKTIKDILSKSRAVFPFFGILLRFSAASRTFMSSSYGRDTCHFEFYTMKRKDPYETASSGLAAYQAILQSLAKDFNGRSHWGKSGMYYHSREMIEMKLDPVARSSFLAKMNEYDPEGIFMNSFGQRLKGEGEKIDFDPATTHCALLDNCVCSENEDCADGQVCTQIDGYPNHRVCNDENYATISLTDLNPIAYEFNSSHNLAELLCTSELGPVFLATYNCTNHLINSIVPAQLPEIPELSELPEIPEIPEIPELPKLPKLPIPSLPLSFF